MTTDTLLTEAADALETLLAFQRASLTPGERDHCIELVRQLREREDAGKAEVPREVIRAAERTREDLGPCGKNYPDIRALLGFVEGLATKPGDGESR